MRHTNTRIGFDDRLVTVILVPVAALIIPFIFFGMRFNKQPYFTGKVYLSVLIITANMVGNIGIFLSGHVTAPTFEEVRKKALQSVTMLVYTIVPTTFLAIYWMFAGLKGNTMKDTTG
jgi:hypothetical protein